MSEIVAELQRSWRRLIVVMTTEKTLAISSTNDDKRTSRRRQAGRCYGLYSPMAVRGGDHPRCEVEEHQAYGVWRAFATYSNIHGVRNFYRAKGQ